MFLKLSFYLKIMGSQIEQRIKHLQEALDALNSGTPPKDVVVDNFSKEPDFLSKFPEKEVFLRKYDEKHEALVREQALLELKKKIITREIQKIDDPKIAALLDLVQQKYGEYESFKHIRSLLDSKEKSLAQREQDLLERTALLDEQRKSLQQQVQSLEHEKSKIESDVDSLERKKSELLNVTEELNQNIYDLEQKTALLKKEFETIKDLSQEESLIIEKVRTDIENKRKLLERDRLKFEDQKKIFSNHIDELTEQSKKEIELYRQNLSSELSLKIDAVNKKAKELESHEKVLRKLEAELIEREKKLERSLELFNAKVIQLESKEHTLDTKKEELSSKEKSLEMYASELRELEDSVTELKEILDKKQMPKIDSLISAIEKSLFQRDYTAARNQYMQARDEYFLLSASQQGSYKQKLHSLFKKIQLNLGKNQRIN